MSTERTTGFVVRHAPGGRLDRVLEGAFGHVADDSFGREGGRYR